MMRFLAALLLLPVVAVAAQAPDSFVVTGPSNTQVPICNLLVTVPGSAQSRLCAILANTSGITGSTIDLTAAGTSGLYDAQISVSGGGSQAANGSLNYTAGQHNFNTYDGTIQFSIGLQPASVEYWEAQGATVGIGANLFATNGTPLTGNVDGNFVAQNNGNLWFGSGSGWGLEVADPGAPITSNMIIRGGTSTLNPKISSPGNLQLDGSSASIVGNSGAGVVLSYGGVQQLLAEPQGSGSIGAAYVQVGSASGDAFAHVACRGATNVNCYFQASGNGVTFFANDVGVMFQSNVSAANTVVDYPFTTAASTTVPIELKGHGGASVAVGSPSLAAAATQGFFLGPLCVAAPTGTPAVPGGHAPQCYNPVTHSLNIYDTGASPGWYHVTLTVGAN